MKPGHPSNALKVAPRSRNGFTLIEIMVVVGIMAIIVAMGIPSIKRWMNPSGMPKAIDDVTHACDDARARAILSGTAAEVIFHPRDRFFEVSGGNGAHATPTLMGGKEDSAKHFDDDITLELLFVNSKEFTESDIVHVRFFPDGTCDEMKLILAGRNNQHIKISLEVTTSIATPGPIDR